MDKHPPVTKAPIQKPPDKNTADSFSKKWALIIGVVCVLLIFFAIIFIRDPSSSQQFYFKIIMALGCAGIATVIPGFFNIQYKSLISAGGGLAIFAFVYMYTPGVPAIAAAKFDYTLHLLDSVTEQSIQPEKTTVFKIRISDNNTVLNSIQTDDVGSFYFNSIPPECKDKLVRIDFEGLPKWTFSNGKQSEEFQLTGTGKNIRLIKNPDFYKIDGILYGSDTKKGLPGVLISVQGGARLDTISNSTGYFSISIPLSDLRTMFTLQLERKGYIPQTLAVALGSHSERTLQKQN
jgi:hypothetical protein